MVGDDGNVVKLEILDPESHAVECLDRSCGLPFSATDMREMVSKLLKNPNDKEINNQLTEFIPKDKIDVLLSIFRDEEIKKPSKELEEVSVSGGAGGYGGPFSGKIKRRKPKKQQENIDTSLIDDVMRLIMERGIMQ